MSEALWNAMARAQELTRRSAYGAAIEAWRDVLTEDPMIADAHAGLAQCLIQEHRMIGARAEATRALELDAENTLAMMALALCDFFENRRKSALSRLGEVLAINPRDVDALQMKSQFLRDRGDWQAADDAISEALEISPGNRASLLEKARVSHSRGRLDAAEQQARTLVAEDPRDVGALVLLGEICRDRGNVDEAYRLVMSALSIDANNAEALDLMGGVKLSRNLIGGIYWHIARFLRRLGNRWLLWFAWGLWLGYMMVLSTMGYFEASELVRWLFVAAYLAFALGIYANRLLVDRIVRKELQQFRMSSDY
ncbi:tetratricopeptide repeat protein [Alteraurantiacibacter aquimixticola]|uniref:Tetratricopeptide repeat protein n=1 Tax=Alteraurantiacibacter aquimixticola TaxID=2489173 RepID=A0A4T3EZV4_9SPHN|nr:tetratricopeptide repeat protein [Alteraurantiacibacter aquimixticola]TIX49462.1 tetratricopeptide repeat protein [Alteraurantiacibacter aquimixticola]